MARPKKTGIVLGSLEECTVAMGELLLAQVQLEALTADRDLAVAEAQVRWEASIDKARSQAADLETALQNYYYAHIPEIEKDGVKHLDLATGRMGRRTNPAKTVPLNRSWIWARITQLVNVVHGTRFNLAPKPKLDLDKLRAELAIEELKQLGLKVEQGETFYAEPARLPGPEVKA